MRDYTVSGNSSNTILNINAGLKTSRNELLQDIMRELRKFL